MIQLCYQQDFNSSWLANFIKKCEDAVQFLEDLLNSNWINSFKAGESKLVAHVEIAVIFCPHKRKVKKLDKNFKKVYCSQENNSMK